MKPISEKLEATNSSRQMNTLVMGTDTTAFGIDLTSPFFLHPSMKNIFDLHPVPSSPTPPDSKPPKSEPDTTENFIPDFYLPVELQYPFSSSDEQRKTNPNTTYASDIVKLPPAAKHVKNFTDENLCFIFFYYARDNMQFVAASELHRRGWDFHTQLKTWLKRDPNAEESAFTRTVKPIDPNSDLARRMPAGSVIQITTGPFLIFDVNLWVFRQNHLTLEHHLLEHVPPPVAKGG